MAAAASTSGSPTSVRSSHFAKDTLETCKELQQDELLALEAIYEGRVRHRRQSDGELACFIDVDIDLQSAREVTIIEQAVGPPLLSQAQPRPARHANGRSADGAVTSRPGRGRGGRGKGKQGDRLPPPSPARPLHSGRAAPADGDLQEGLEGLALARPVAKEEAPPPVETGHEMRLQYLPPILMSVTLPPAYPTEQPPVIALDAAWLSDTLRHLLLERIEPLWQSDPCIYLLIDEIQAFFGDLDSSLPNTTRLTVFDRYITRLPSASAGETPRTPLSSILANHDHSVRHSTFSSESFDCGICLETKKGIRCTRLESCGHVFCVECLYSFFELNIREGMVKNVSCADAECVKSKSKEGGSHTAGVVSEEEIEAIVGKDLADRYRWLVKKQKIESDPTITYCPRDGCNAPVAKELDEAYDRLRECSACGYSFCVYCRRTYHGTKSRCVFNQASTIIDKYVNGTEKEQADLEVRYGKTNVKKLVEMYLEEQANARWIESNTTRCPDCSLDVERSFGCAHMTCGRCSCHFCFRCGARLNAKDPYLHYSTPGQSCFNRLFDHVASEEQENMALFDAVMQEHD